MYSQLPINRVYGRGEALAKTRRDITGDCAGLIVTGTFGIGKTRFLTTLVNEIGSEFEMVLNIKMEGQPTSTLVSRVAAALKIGTQGNDVPLQIEMVISSFENVLIHIDALDQCHKQEEAFSTELLTVHPTLRI